MNDLSLLKSLGLSETDVRIYQALLTSGSASIRQVAKQANINRGTTYEALKRLASIGLVSFTRRGERRKFVADNPEKIYELINERKHELANAEAAAQKLVPALAATSKHSSGEPSVRFYEDDEGIVTILRDVINTTMKLEPKEYRVYSSKPLRSYIYRRFPNFTRGRIKQNISVKAIAVGAGGEPEQLSERKWLDEPPRQYLSSYILIYGDKLAIISVSPDDTPYGVVIEEPGVAATQKHVFDSLWHSLPNPKPES